MLRRVMVVAFSVACLASVALAKSKHAPIPVVVVEEKISEWDLARINQSNQRQALATADAEVLRAELREKYKLSDKDKVDAKTRKITRVK